MRSLRRCRKIPPLPSAPPALAQEGEESEAGRGGGAGGVPALGPGAPAGMGPGAAAAAAAAGAAAAEGEAAGLPPAEFLALQRRGGVGVFDVRSPGEFKKGHVPGAVRARRGGGAPRGVDSSPSATCPAPPPVSPPLPALLPAGSRRYLAGQGGLPVPPSLLSGRRRRPASELTLHVCHRPAPRGATHCLSPAPCRRVRKN